MRRAKAAPRRCIRAMVSSRRMPISPRRATAAGLVFVGPPAAAIRAMGSKAAAKALMVKAGVPVVPGYHGDDQNPDRLAEEARRVGFPVLIKASAGGGGRGMRIVRAPADFGAALAEAKRESLGAFGDDHMLIEKYLDRAAAYRSPNLRRPARQYRPHLRSRLLDPAPAPEGGRGGAGPRARQKTAPCDGRGRPPRGARRRLRGRRHGRIRGPDGPARRVLFYRDEHAPSGRARGDRSGDRARPRRVAIAGRRGREAAIAAKRACRLRPRDRGAALRRRPRPRLSAADRDALSASPAAARDRAGRYGRALGRPHHPRLRPDDRQNHRLGRRPRCRDRTAAPRPGDERGPGPAHQSRVSVAHRRRPRFCRGCRRYRLYRATPRELAAAGPPGPR